MEVSGNFEVVMRPLEYSQKGNGVVQMGRMSLDKTYHGDLSATGKGEMLSARSSVKGSAGYVAMEVVSGTLMGKQGSFVLQHSGTMSGNGFKLTVEVVPDTATEELTGLTGKMAIEQIDGKHQYQLEFTLPTEN